MIKMSHPRFHWATWAAFALVFFVYVSNAWTPSSYAVVLHSIGITNGDPILGTARPIRSDEYSVQTPHFQMAVLSGLKNVEQISPYRESMKNFMAFPTKDWSVIFKPQLWGFLLLRADYAYSLYFAVLAAAFLGGWCLFFRILGIDSRYAILGALLLFFSHFIQVWWTTNAASFAFAPWVAIAFIRPSSFVVRALLVLYSVAVWFFGLLYPPFLYGMAFAMATAILALKPDALKVKNILAAVLGALVAGALVFYYMHDMVEIMRNTVYPGKRSVSGGTVSIRQVLATLLPYINTLQFDPTPIYPDAINECEAGTVSSFLALLVLCFAEGRSLIDNIRSNKRTTIIFLAAAAFCCAWMLLPIPAWVGRLALLHMMPPRRMLLAFGFIVHIAILALLPKLRWAITGPRLVTFVVCVTASFLLAKSQLPLSSLPQSWFDFLIIPLSLAAIIAGHLLKRTVPAGALLLAASAACNALTFGTFNPLQSATPIFNQHDTDLIKDLQRLERIDARGWVYLNGWYGATINGLGIEAINDTPMSPQQVFFAHEFPDLSDFTKNNDFNRYAHIIPTFQAEPSVTGDKLFVPLQHFARNDRVVAKTIEDSLPWNGSIDSYSIIEASPGHYAIEIAGWGNFTSVNDEQKVAFNGVSLTPTGLARDLRPDVSKTLKDTTMSLSGFRAFFETRQPDANDALQLASIDPKRGDYRIPNLTIAHFTTQWPPVRAYKAIDGKGYVDTVNVHSGTAGLLDIDIAGWLPFVLEEGQSVNVISPAHVKSLSLRRTYRQDLIKVIGENWGMSGFTIHLQTSDNVTFDPSKLCVLARDPKVGTVALHAAGDPCGAHVPQTTGAGS
ncbi:DUF7657 domain-containing protein [Rhodanobacter denitrificans]|uniref:DUF7657 domain-containing protein n=1 Tax=Rhodanobacter denitrificans TaxID=666685 RepID=UPI0011C0735A|nr:hypothetical protein [Rhodanobacter denitrificans]